MHLLTTGPNVSTEVVQHSKSQLYIMTIDERLATRIALVVGHFKVLSCYSLFVLAGAFKTGIQ